MQNVQFHLARNKSMDWSQMGLGKSVISLEKIRILYNQGLIKYILIICPLSVLETWTTEIEKHTTFSYTRLTGSLENKVKLLANKTSIFLISYDTIPGRKKTLGILLSIILQKHFDFIILDEVTYLKNFRALRTKAITYLCDRIKRSIALSGTPILNAPECVLALYRVADGGETFGRNYFTARSHFFINHGYGFPDWHIREDTKEEFKNRLFYNAIRLTKDECLDLPKKVYTERYTELDGVQKEIYKKIAEELLKELRLPAGKVQVKNSLVKLSKLSQLTSGFLYTDQEVQLFPENPKLELLRQTLLEIPEEDKIIIFCRWTQDITNISKLLNNLNISYEILQGSTTNRQVPIQSFVAEPNTKILLSQITVGAYGLNLTASHVVLYYSLGFSAVEFWQSQDRIHRFGQTKPCIYLNLLCNKTVDNYIYMSLQRNTDIAKSLLDSRFIKKLEDNLCL